MGLTALLLHCTCRQRSVILQAASTAKAPLTEQMGEWIWGCSGISEPLRHPSPLLPKECSSFQPVLRAQELGKVTRCIPAACGLWKQVLVAPHRGVVQRHTKGRQPGGCAIINSLVTGLFSLPQCLITACSLWQYSWYIQVLLLFRAGREELPDRHQG